MISRYVVEYKPNYLVTLADIPWVSYLAADDFQEVLSRTYTQWCLYYPVDGTLPDGSLPRDWKRVLSKVHLPVTMSKFGVAGSAKSGIDATFIPHGCETELFRPPDSKEEAKHRFGYRGKFVVLSDVRNHRRKLIPRALDIIGRLKIPNNRLVFHLHTMARPQEDTESYRYDVRADIDTLRLPIVKGVRDGAESDAFPMNDLAELYAAADVHLLTSHGEGFGLPTLQAASSGAVPIAPANSASTELVGNHGFAVSCSSWTTDEFGLVRGFIDRRQAASALQALYDNPDLLRARSIAARGFALAFSWDNVAARWNALLRERMADRGRMAGCVAPGRSNSPPDECKVAPITPRSAKGPSLRPTGHDRFVLPIPRIGVPTRLEVWQRDALATATPIVLAESSCVRRLRVLERVFPGTRVVEVFSSTIGHQEVRKLMDRAMLVVDPKCRLPGLDLLCAHGGINFLGRSAFWPPVAGRSLLGQARLLLTDYPLSEQRAILARQRVGVTPDATAISRLTDRGAGGIRSSHTSTGERICISLSSDADSHE